MTGWFLRHHRPGARLDTPLHVFTGTEDAGVRAADLPPWLGESAAPGGIHSFPGGHFFPHTAEAQVLARLRALLA